ncbi:MAG: helicase [Candidatus Nitrosoglobus sp.]
MIVLFVSECEKAAWKRSRRILSHYAVQIGRRTWLTRISEEGLRNIRRELTQAASRHTAVVCHRIKGRYQTELIWIVGSRRHFSRSGEFAFSHSAIPLPIVNEDTPPAVRLLNHLCILAGLFHDLGKHGAYFQHKLRDEKSNQSDPIRHERISLLLLLRLITLIALPATVDNTPPAPPRSRRCVARVSNRSTIGLANLTDDQWLKSLTDSKNIYQALQQLWNENPNNDWRELIPIEGSTLRPEWSSTEGDRGLPPLLSVLCFLIISHHKLPDGHEDDFTPLEETYLNRPENLLNGLQLATDHQPAWLQSPKWVNDITKHARRAHYLLQEYPLPLQDRALWYSAARYMARCAIVLADHSVSSKAKIEIPIDPQSTQAQVCFANSWQGQLRQTLAAHLERVGRLSGKAFNHLHQLQHGRKASAIETSPAPLIIPITEEAFIWQEKAERKLLQAQRQGNNANEGFFALVMAETGSGKTRGNARILAATNNHQNYRLTVALGLRTLTLQTGDEYRDDLGFGSTPDAAGEQCAVMVGGALTIALHEMTDTGEETRISLPQQLEQAGIESSSLDDFVYECITGEFDYDPDAPWPEDLTAPNNPKLNRLLQVPILICTIDHLMPFIQSQRASAAVLGFRLAGSDLIIDEIDSFSTDDLPALLKLAYVVGFNGRKLLLSSATLPPATARAFYRAYQTGFNRWQQLQGIEPSPICCGWFSHHAAHIKLTSIADNATFAKQHSQFINTLLDTLQQQPVRRRLSADLVPIVENAETAYRNVMQSCWELHQQWANCDPVTGVRYSIGCVRWSNVAHTRGFADYWLNKLVNLDKEVQVKLICYHAKHLPLIRHRIEQILNALLTRKGNQQPHNHPTLRVHLENCQQQGKTQLLVIVSTSPISEVGRDHDYDWGIVEPNSYWSLIQMAGRIWRHRRHLAAFQPNMRIMSQTMRGLNNKPMRFTQPGPESNGFALYSDNATELDQVFDLDSLQKRIDARFTLQEPAAIQVEKKQQYLYPDMRQLEHGQLQILLENTDQRKQPMYFIKGCNPQVLLTQQHSNCCPFRKGENGNLLWFEDDAWKYLEKKDARKWLKNKKDTSVKIIVITNQVKKEDTYQYPEQSYFAPEELSRYSLYERWRGQLAQRGLDKSHIVNALPLSFGDTFEDEKHLYYSDLIGWLFAK